MTTPKSYDVRTHGCQMNVHDSEHMAGLLEGAHGSGDVAVMGVCQDSRTVEPGDLFLAWRGTAVDAHGFVADAARGGAVAAVVERIVDLPVPQLVVSNGRAAAARVAHLVLGSPSDRLVLRRAGRC